MTYAQLRSLLVDCLTLWEVRGKVRVDGGFISIETSLGVFTVVRADVDMRPLQWFYQTPERAAGQRPPRAAASVVGLLSALRNAMEGVGGQRLRIGGALFGGTEQK